MFVIKNIYSTYYNVIWDGGANEHAHLNRTMHVRQKTTDDVLFTLDTRFTGWLRKCVLKGVESRVLPDSLTRIIHEGFYCNR
ncbi:MAG: hypothetical protein OJF51_000072 [Nitrospira sp.]|nr:MAG: hypothetical protein OJF51_000072 [Nitrospira sp.]